MIVFCKHEWSLLSETTTKSKLEITMSSLPDRTTMKGKVPWQLCDASRKHIQTFSCRKCGKL